MRSPGWYSMQTVLAWRASIEIPRNWIIVVHNENAKSHPVSTDTTDIIKVCLEAQQRHWTLVHLSVKDWVVTYYDSFVGSTNETENDMHMTLTCTQLVHSVRGEHPLHGTTLPAHDPPMSAEVCQTKPMSVYQLIDFVSVPSDKLIPAVVDHSPSARPKSSWDSTWMTTKNVRSQCDVDMFRPY